MRSALFAVDAGICTSLSELKFQVFLNQAFSTGGALCATGSTISLNGSNTFWGNWAGKCFGVSVVEY